MIPFTSNQRYSQPSTPKLEKISLIKNPQIHHPVLGGTDTLETKKHQRPVITNFEFGSANILV